MHFSTLTTAVVSALAISAEAHSIHRHIHSHQSLHHDISKRATGIGPYTNLTNPIAHVKATALSYKQTDFYHPGNFFQSFDAFTADDPTHGFVDYQALQPAWAKGLVNTNGNTITLHVDRTAVVPPGARGRPSVRMTSKKAFTHGLFVADILHMPSATCGVWPAYWLFGPGWPASGEIDIIEGVNDQTCNAVTLHTAPGCTMSNDGSLPGTVTQERNCNAGSAFTGCSARTADPRNYGDAFNAGQGGTYAMQWEASGVYVWFWPRGAVPADVTSGRPDTRGWGKPLVAFNGNGGCDVDRYFKNMNIVFDTTFCGDWAGAVWQSGGCARKTGRATCEEWVRNNPAAFGGAYWAINSVRVYQLG
jgi:hypothetical protein